MECVKVMNKDSKIAFIAALVGIGFVLATFTAGEGGALKWLVLTTGIVVILAVTYTLFIYEPDEDGFSDYQSNDYNDYENDTVEQFYGLHNQDSPAEKSGVNQMANNIDNIIDAAVSEDEFDVPDNNKTLNQNNVKISRSEPLGMNEDYKSVAGELSSRTHLPNDCYPKDVLSPQELLPKDVDSVWAQTVPSGQGSLSDKNFLNAGFHVGVNTVGQSLRNANRQIRSEPPNPQVKVSPWLQTTIEPDLGRKPMEIGGCA